MKYSNPVVRGMYPDPSVCRAGDKYYMVCSSFALFPGVPIFESENMVNWKLIGHCLTRESQLKVRGVSCSGGIFAPTIRYHNGRFYMVTTNDSLHENFYVYSDDIYGEWSDPIIVEQDGIDPSLFFEGEKSYFISNGADEKGLGCIQMCEIDIETGKKLSETKVLWQGTGGRYLEAPHLYRFGDWYYLLEAEGGTEYGHMVNYARSKSMWGPFESYSGNPVLTNRNLGGYLLQGAGHGDIVEDKEGNWWFAHLAFRQIDRWLTFHHLGREVCMEPLHWNDDGWFTIGMDGIAAIDVEVPDISNEVVQDFSYHKTFETLNWDKDWSYLRIPDKENYKTSKHSLSLRGTKHQLSELASPTFIALRQDEFTMELSLKIKPAMQEAGISLYMDDTHHYEVAVNGREGQTEVSVRYTIGSCASGEIASVTLAQETVELRIEADPLYYYFFVETEGKKVELGKLETRYLSSEVAGGFTGALIGLYAVDAKEQGQWAEFSDLHIIHK
ncbi:MAG: glycoside hydrolase family 43 protein [bacterium]|nr:glycoside hydrolase family 43 protein [bacterium]